MEKLFKNVHFTGSYGAETAVNLRRGGEFGDECPAELSIKIEENGLKFKAILKEGCFEDPDDFNAPLMWRKTWSVETADLREVSEQISDVVGYVHAYELVEELEELVAEINFRKWELANPAEKAIVRVLCDVGDEGFELKELDVPADIKPENVEEYLYKNYSYRDWGPESYIVCLRKTWADGRETERPYNNRGQHAALCWDEKIPTNLQVGECTLSTCAYPKAVFQTLARIMLHR